MADTPRPAGRRRPTDYDLVFFLFRYARSSPECHPLFKEYLLNVVLKGHTFKKRMLSIDFYLRNWEIKKFYDLGPEFLDFLSQYEIYDFLFPADGIKPFKEVVPHIGDSYKPHIVPIDTATVPPASTSIYITPLPSPVESRPKVSPVLPSPPGLYPPPEEPDEDYTVASDEDLYGDETYDSDEHYDEDTLGKLGIDTTEPQKEEDAPPDDSQTAETEKAKPVPGSREDLLEKLEKISAFSPPTVQKVPRQTVEPWDRVGDEWWNNSTYNGTRQPSIGVRLLNIINFLSEEDVDRCAPWDTQFRDIVDYLTWLMFEDKSRQLDSISGAMWGMFLDTVDKAKTHLLFEKHHSDPTPLGVPKPPKVPLKLTRLNGLGNVHNWPQPARASAPNLKDLLPSALHPREPGPVNVMAHQNRAKSGAYRRLFVPDEKKFWQDDKFVSYYVAKDEEGFVRGHRPDEIGKVYQYPDTSRGWALERGIRRAGLQQLLRLYSQTDGNFKILSQIPPRKLVLPVEGAVLQKARQQANGPQWEVPRLSDTELGGFVETMPYIIAFREHFKKLTRTRELAILQAEQSYRNDSTWVTLPRNIVTGGPFIWRMMDPESQSCEDLLNECYLALKTLENTYEREPRELLGRMLELIRDGLEGKYANHAVPFGISLARDEYDKLENGEYYPTLVNYEDLKWVQFLSTPCKNADNWTGRFVPDEPRDKYRLFLIFANRVKRLIDDQSPDGLFSLKDASVTVDELLKVINARSNFTEGRYTFEPHDACHWLDRMRRSGHVEFRLSPLGYGVVKRPRFEYFPEHLVLWPKKEEHLYRPTYLGHVLEWKQIADETFWETHQKNTGKILNFFAALAFRLGYTIYLLELERRDRENSSRPPLPVRNLVRSIRKFEKECAKESKPDEPPDGLARLVKDINPWDAEKLLEVEETKDKRRDRGKSREGEPVVTPPPEKPSREEMEKRALDLIRNRIIAELNQNLTMLGPGREHHYFDPQNPRNIKTAYKYDFHWDWATSRKPAKQFWNVNRWPVDSGYLSRRANEAAKNDVFDERMVYDPAKEDVTDREVWRVTKSEPFDKDVKFKPGPATYMIGDTPIQRRFVEDELTLRANIAFNKYAPTGTQTWGETLARLNPFFKSSAASQWPPTAVPRASSEEWMPPVNDKKIPRSWDLKAEARARAAELGRVNEPGVVVEEQWDSDDDDVKMSEFDDEDYGESLGDVEVGGEDVGVSDEDEYDEDDDVSMVEI